MLQEIEQAETLESNKKLLGGKTGNRYWQELTPSGLKTSHGCKDISTTRSTFSDLSRNEGYFSQIAW